MHSVGKLPFASQVDYDYTAWIDSDQLFTPQLFRRLLDRDRDIVAGVYRMSGGQYLATVLDWDEAFFRAHGHFPFLTPADIKGQTDLIALSYTGLGFILVKRGVFESMSYPWFAPRPQQIANLTDFGSEDVSFCLRAGEYGYPVRVDPGMCAGHGKRVVQGCACAYDPPLGTFNDGGSLTAVMAVSCGHRRWFISSRSAGCISSVKVTPGRAQRHQWQAYAPMRRTSAPCS